jgi:uncharacterized membrane protein
MIAVITALVILNIALLIYAIGVKIECNELENEILEIYNCINNDN